MANHNILDLFSGAGGMAEGFLQAGFKVPNACDYSKEASETYQFRHKQLGYTNSIFHQGDIKELTKSDFLRDFLNGNPISVVVGGPPCQGFSLTGKRDKKDPRNYLFLDYLKIVKMVKPKYFVMENVEGILSFTVDRVKAVSGTVYENITVPEIIVREAEKFGYCVRYKLLNAKNYGVPQNRPRVIFLGHQVTKINQKVIDLVPPPNFPQEHNYIITVEEAISDLRFLKNGQSSTQYNKRYKLSEYQSNLRGGLTPNINGFPIESLRLSNHDASKHGENVVERFKMLRQSESIAQLLSRLDEDEKEKYYTRKYRCAKLHKSKVAPTILTLPDDIVHYDPNNPRILTVRELARLQSFDDSFQFLGNRTTGGYRRKFETPQYTQVGNAVPPLFAKAIALEIMNALTKKENEKGETYASLAL
ncbi:DNA cytosine methyltransferase [Paenibacillus sp. GM2]|uniref:DNA cytosine methyltransferase n=1 Tax=Paenibacillus sp. GM2 TaxID=1622070 RepID=UPI000837B3C7|nr:DNA cytosine methyltransferase [Paenibacillus sp. GM2]